MCVPNFVAKSFVNNRADAESITVPRFGLQNGGGCVMLDQLSTQQFLLFLQSVVL